MNFIKSHIREIVMLLLIIIMVAVAIFTSVGSYRGQMHIKRMGGEECEKKGGEPILSSKDPKLDKCVFYY